MKKNMIIIIPVFNEQKYIKNVIKSVIKNIDFRLIDILVINDGSTDKTEEYLSKINIIKKINQNKNRGYGRSLIDGFQYAITNQYKYMITMDCDRQHEPFEIPEFIKAIKKDDHDIISGSRYLKKINIFKKIFIPKNRYIINKKITEKINDITDYGLTDSFCGFKAYKTAALKKINLSETGYGLPLQLWLQAKKNNLKIKEIPVKLIYLDHTRNFKNNFISFFRRYKYYLKIILKEQ